MNDCADARIGEGEDIDALLGQTFDQISGCPSSSIDEDHVGLNGLQIHRKTLHGVDGLRQFEGSYVVVGQALDVVVERVESGSGEDACLPHAAAEHLAPAVGFIDRRSVRNQQGSNGCAQSFGEADCDAVEIADHPGRLGTGGHNGVEDASSIEVSAAIVGVGDGAYLVQR